MRTLLVFVGTAVGSIAFQLTVAFYPQYLKPYAWTVKWIWVLWGLVWVLWLLARLRIATKTPEYMPIAPQVPAPEQRARAEVKDSGNATVSNSGNISQTGPSVSQVFNIGTLPAAPPPQPQPAAIPQLPRSNLTFLRARATLVSARGQNRYASDEPDEFLEIGPNGNGSQAVVACFRNSAPCDRAVADEEFVRAHIIFRDKDGEEVGEGVPSACWLSNHFETIDFRVGDAHCILVAILIDESGRWVVPRKSTVQSWQGSYTNTESAFFDGISSAELTLIGQGNRQLLPPVILEIGISAGKPIVGVKQQ